jgi:RND family efflux transporter MFP subunit
METPAGLAKLRRLGNKPPGPYWLKRHWLLAGCALVLAVLPGCGERNKFVAPPAPTVFIQVPVQKMVTTYLEATGSVASENSVNLIARVQGYVQEIKYQDGAPVKKGTPLFVIEPEPYWVKLQQAQAAEEGAKATFVEAEAEYDRQRDLQLKQVSSQKNLDQARASRDTGHANVLQARANVEAAEINVGYTQVTAPFDGVVTARNVSIGEVVGGDQPNQLATIVQLHPIWVWFNISERDVQRMRAALAAENQTVAQLINKAPVEVETQTETRYAHKGVLDYVDPTVDLSTGTLRVRGAFENPGNALMPGYFVRVRVPLRPTSALLVPETAVGADQGGRYVLLVDKDNVVEQRRVQLGQAVGQMRIIESGLAPADRIVISGIQDAIPGQKVNPQERTPEVATTDAPTP